MDNVLHLKDYKVARRINEDFFGLFVRNLKNKYGNRRPPLMINTIDNFNNEGKLVVAGGPSEDEVWFVYIPSEERLYYLNRVITLKAPNPTQERT